MNENTMLEPCEVENVADFIFGGHSEFTIKNMNSGRAFKYRVSEAKKKKDLFYVSVNESGSYVYAGYIQRDSNRLFYSKGRNGYFDTNTDPIKGLLWSIRKGNNPLPRPMIMLHHGKCACCGKKLDDEISVARGFGPVCWKRLHERAVGGAQ